jgi:hypothetical protein
LRRWGNGIAQRFHVPGYDGYLPFFLWGEELEAFESRREVELREEHLLKGILYGLYEFENDPKPWHRGEDKKTLLYLLDVLGNGFKFESPERMVLDVAAGLRKEIGSVGSRIILEVGKNLIPASAKIKSDLICDSWAVVAENEGQNQLFDEIIDLVAETNLEEIRPDAKEIICYYGLCAIVLQGRWDEISAYLSKHVYPNVSTSKLKIQIKALLENPERFSAQELRIF